MKSNFSRFLHHTMSYSGLTRISRWKKFANWFDLDTPVKPECDTLGKHASSGRSMVEMLGVLAIIGVLSVGAIAGYSKAMMKYKLNKQAEGVTMLLANCIPLSKQLPAKNEWKMYTDILSKLNLLPDSVSLYGDNKMKDILGTESYFYHTSGENEWGIFYNVPESSFGKEICYNLIKTAQEFHADMYSIFRSKNHTEAYQEVGAHYYGDKYCNNTDKKCMRDMTMSDIHALCTDKGDKAEDFKEFDLWLLWKSPEL